MDRFTNSLFRSLMWPLLGAALIGIPWLAARQIAPSPQRDVPSAATASRIPPGRPTAEPAQPGLLPLGELAQGLPASGGYPRLVLKTGFPGDHDPTQEDGLIGPELFGTPQPRPETAIRVIPVDPADWSLPPEQFAPSEQSAQPAPADSPADRTPSDSAAPAPLQAAEPALQSLQSTPEPEPSMLMPFDELKPRSEQLEGIARQSDLRVRHGFELAGKGAYFAARAEFVAALRLLAQGLDAEYQTNVHSQSLAAALTALQEAEDFIPKGSHLEADLDVPGLIGRHRTPVLKDVDTRTVSPMLALRCYFTFAQEQFAAAARHEVAGSMALHAMGKLHAAYARHKTIRVGAAEPKAMTFYQAAMLVFPRNYMAANDLGVLLAQAGAWPEARAAFEHSLSICRQSAGWQNLAVVCQQLGQTELARRANWQAETTRRAEAARAAGVSVAAQQSVRWVDPRAFAQAAGDVPAVPQAEVAAEPRTVPPPSAKWATTRATVTASPPTRRTAQQSQSTRN
jgi:tetratricopeptide (TPR) repeat protein